MLSQIFHAFFVNFIQFHRHFEMTIHCNSKIYGCYSSGQSKNRCIFFFFTDNGHTYENLLNNVNNWTFCNGAIAFVMIVIVDRHVEIENVSFCIFSSYHSFFGPLPLLAMRFFLDSLFCNAIVQTTINHEEK